MKNKFNNVITKVMMVVAACLMFASFSPSLDGRAIVVEDGVFPQGLFAKTVGYLPGDVISVANITGETTVDLLVIGALDPSEGVAIMLSPEAAAAIGIDRNANNIVKITKRSGQDERVYGTAVIAKQNQKVEDAYEDFTIQEESSDAFEEQDEEKPEEKSEEPVLAATEETEKLPEESSVEESPAEEEKTEAVEETPVESEAEDESEAPAESDDFIEEEMEEEPFEEEAIEETPVQEEVPAEEENLPEEAVEEEILPEENVEEEAVEE